MAIVIDWGRAPACDLRVMFRARRLNSFACHSAAAGYYLATCSSEAVKLWDLRKLRTFATLTPYEAGQPGCTAVEFDHSGLFLAIGGADARIVGQKQARSAPPLRKLLHALFLSSPIT